MVIQVESIVMKRQKSFISVVVDSQGEKSGIGHFFANTGSNVQ